MESLLVDDANTAMKTVKWLTLPQGIGALEPLRSCELDGLQINRKRARCIVRQQLVTAVGNRGANRLTRFSRVAGRGHCIDSIACNTISHEELTEALMAT
jgi:hypothetical protein